MSEWLAVEAIIRQKDKEKTAMAVAKLSSGSGSDKNKDPEHFEVDDEDDDDDEDYLMNDVFEENDLSENIDSDEKKNPEPLAKKPNKSSTDSGNVPDDCCNFDTDEKEKVIENDDNVGGNRILLNSKDTSPSTPSSYQTVENDYFDYFIDRTGTSCPDNPKPMEGIEKFASIEDISMKINDEDDDEETSQQLTASVIVTNASIDISNLDRDVSNGENAENRTNMSPLQEEPNTLDALQEPKSACVSPASSNGGVYSVSIGIRSLLAIIFLEAF